MRQTLFYIPNFLFEGPLLIAWLIVGLIIMATLYFRKDGIKEVIGFVPIYLIVAVVIWLLLPKFVVKDIDDNAIGLAVRGYGFFMLLAIVVGLAVTWVRCKQIDYPFDPVLSLSFWMIVFGIGGARIFYLVQKRHQITVDAPADAIKLLVDMTQGGLVVYGAVIGGVAALLVIVFLKKLPLLKITDIIAPGMIIGLAIGRIGCLMNGCCFGGLCEIDQIGIQFPAGSLSYDRQIETGELFGLKTKAITEQSSNEYPFLLVENVQPDSMAAQLGIEIGDKIQISPEDAEVIRAIKLPDDPDLFDSAVKAIRLVNDSSALPRVADSLDEMSRNLKAGKFDNNTGIVEQLSSNHPIPAVTPAWQKFYEFVAEKTNVEKNDDAKSKILKTIGRAVKWQHKSIVLMNENVHHRINVFDSLPISSRKVHPTQIYSSINATLIFLFLWFYFPYRRSNGEVFAWLLILYAITRFLLEMIRIDEAPVGNTPFTISQWVSFATLAAGISYMIYSRLFGKFQSDDGQASAPVAEIE